MGFVDECQEALWEEIQKRGRRFSRIPRRKVHGIILNPIHIPGLQHHLDIVFDLRLQPLGLHELSIRMEIRKPILELFADHRDDLIDLVGRGDGVLRRKNLDCIDHLEDLSGNGMPPGNPIELVSEEFAGPHRFPR